MRDLRQLRLAGRRASGEVSGGITSWCGVSTTMFPTLLPPKDYPDPDCPPHFYAHGHNPQYRHFGWLMKYMNRVCNLISGGHHSAPVAVIYSGEGDWTGKYMNIDAIGAVLTEHQIEYDIVPQDVFANPEFYRTFIGNHVLKVNTQTYRAVVVPYMQYITKALAETITVLNSEGIPCCLRTKRRRASATRRPYPLTVLRIAEPLRQTRR